MGWLNKIYNGVKNFGKGQIRENYEPVLAATGNNNLTAIIDSVGLRIRPEFLRITKSNYEIPDKPLRKSNGTLETLDARSISSHLNGNLRDEKITLELYNNLDSATRKEISDFIKFCYARRLKENSFNEDYCNENLKKKLMAQISLSAIVPIGMTGKEKKIGYDVVKNVIDSNLDEIKFIEC